MATGVAVVLWVALGDMLGQGQLLDAGRSWLIRVAIVETGWSVVLALPVSWLYARAARGSPGAEFVGASRGAGRRAERLPVR